MATATTQTLLRDLVTLVGRPSSFTVQRANQDMDTRQLSYIRDFAARGGMIPKIAHNLSKQDAASIYNVALRMRGGSASESSLSELMRRIEAGVLMSELSGGGDPYADKYPLASPPRDLTPQERSIREELERAMKQLRAPLPSPSAQPPADMSEYVKRPEAKEIAQAEATAVLDGASDELCRAAADAAKVATMALLDSFKASEPVTLMLASPANPEPVSLGLVHRKMPDIIKALHAGENVYLHGPAGSGKTTAAQKAAEAFGLQFYFAAKVESEYLLLGFRDARGEAVRTQFRDAYEHGGMFLFDELDGSSPAAIVALNAALANGVCAFPDGIVKRHPDFKCIAGGNTRLRGATGAYTGRAQLDAASIDRFVFIEFDYDEAMEMELASNKRWARYVQAVRKAVNDRAMGDEILITPRATISGCKLLAAGFSANEVKTMTVFKGLDPDTIDQITHGIDAADEYTDEPEPAKSTPQETSSPFAGIDII